MLEPIGPAPPSPGESGQGRQQIEEVARQFEALLLAQLLRSAREAGGGGWLGGSDSSASSLLEMGEDHFAQVLASQGGLGLARLLVAELTKDQPSPAGPGRPPGQKLQIGD